MLEDRGILGMHLVQQNAPALGWGGCFNKPSGTPSLLTAERTAGGKLHVMTVFSPGPCPIPWLHRTTCVHGCLRYYGLKITNDFVKFMAVITSIVTAASYAYAAWNWLENIHTVW